MSKFKIGFIISCLVAMLTLCGGMLLATPQSAATPNRFAEGDSDYLGIVVSKVNVATNLADANAFKNKTPTAAEELQEIENGSTVELTTTPAAETTQAIFIDTVNNAPINASTGEHKTIIIQSVDLTLNGYTLLHNWQTSDKYMYSQYLFGLRSDEVSGKFASEVRNTDTKPETQTGYATTTCSYGDEATTINGYNVKVYSPSELTVIDDVEGFYELKIKYSVVGGETGLDAYFSFYMFRTDTFNPIYEKPTLENVEKIAFTNSQDLNNPILNYFNFNNNSTVAYNGSEFANTKNSNKLLYPTLTYNPEKFNINYRYTRYGYIEEVTTSFSEGILTVENTITGKEGKQTSTFVIPKISNKYSVQIVFDEVGEYTITKTANLTYKAFNNQTNEIETKTKEINNKISKDLLQSETLIINGYVPQYAKTQDENATMYSDNFYNIQTNSYFNTETNKYKVDKVYARLFKNSADYQIANLAANNKIYSADFTFTIKNNENVTKNDLSNLSGLLNKLNATTTEVARTNLPPVSFTYYGRINTVESGYAYRQNASSPWQAFGYTANKNFKEAGEYYVILNYANSLSQYKSDVYNTTGQQPTKAQLFHFFITNEQPQLELLQYTGSTENFTISNSSTLSKKFVNTSVAAQLSFSPSPFDAQVVTEYSIDNGVTWQPFNCYIPDIDNKIVTIFSDSRKYQIRIYKNQNSNSASYSVNYTVTIDKTPISGIKAMSISNNELSSEITSTNGSIIDENFAWTWNDKANGNEITAKYVYAGIVDTSDATYNLEATSDGKMIATTKYKLAQFTAPMNYIKPEPNKGLSTVNQIISNSQVAILMLSDKAGNTASFVTILDKTKSEIFQKENSSYSPVPSILNIKEPTSFYWGTHKSIQIDTSNGSGTDIYTGYKNIDALSNISTWTWNGDTYSWDNESFSDYIMENAGEKYLVLPIQDITFTQGTTNVTRAPSVINNSPINWMGTINVNVETNNEPAIIKSGIVLDTATEDIPENPDYILMKNITSQDQNSIVYNQTIKHSSPIRVEINMDNSQSTMKVDNKVILNGSVTNGSILSFECQDSDDFPIESISLDYYPFEFNKANTTYPFSSIPYSVTLYPSSNAQIDGDKKITINYLMKQSMGNGQTQSREGMYVITRKYKSTYQNGVSQSTEHLQGDSLIKTFTYYVDRKAIIPIDTTTYGDQISLSLGNYSNGIDDKFPKYSDLYVSSLPNFDENLFTQIGNDPVMVTTDFDVKLNLSNYKYSVAEFNKVYAAIVRKDSYGTCTTRIITDFTKSDLICLKSASGTTTYRVILFDSANLPLESLQGDDNTVITNIVNAHPNFTVFTFAIQQTVLNIKVVASDTPIVADSYIVDKLNNLPSIEMKDGKYYTNKNNVYLVWENINNDTMSKIEKVEYNTVGTNWVKLENLIEGENTIHIQFSNQEQPIIYIVKKTTRPMETAKNLINNDKTLTILNNDKNPGTTLSNWDNLFSGSNSTINTFLENYVFTVSHTELSNMLLEDKSYYCIQKTSNAKEELGTMPSEALLTKENALDSEKWNLGRTYLIMEMDEANNATFMTIYLIQNEFSGDLQLSTEELLDDAITTKLITITKGKTYNQANEFDFTRQKSVDAMETYYDTWNIPSWIPVSITNTTAKTSHTFFLIPQTTNLLIFNKQNLNNITIVSNISQLLTELNDFIDNQENEFGSSYVLVLRDSEYFSVVINQAGKELDLSNKVEKYLEKTISAVTFNATKLQEISNDATYITDAYLTVFPTTTLQRSYDLIKNGVIEDRQSINLSSPDDLVTVTLTDNYGRTQKHIIDDENSTKTFYKADFNRNRSESYPITVTTKNVFGQDYQHTISDFYFEYDKRFSVIVTTTDIDNNTTAVYRFDTEGRFSIIKSSEDHKYTFGTGWSVAQADNLANYALKFNALPNSYVLITIEPQLDNTTVVQNIDTKFAIYTSHPTSSLSNKAGAPLGQQDNGSPVITGQPVVITVPNYTDTYYLFNPQVYVLYKKELESANTEQQVSLEEQILLSKNSQVTFTEEGYYTIIYKNDIGVYNPPTGNETTFRIQKNIPELYNVTIKAEGNLENFDYIQPLDTKLKYTTEENKVLYITHYIYQHKTMSTSNDCLSRINVTTNKDRNIECTEVETISGDKVSTVIYKLSGTQNNYIEMFFAVSCIISETDELKNEYGITLANSTNTTQDNNGNLVPPTPESITSDSLVIFVQQPAEENGKLEPVWARFSWNPKYSSGDLTFENFYRLEIYEGEYNENSKPNRIDYSGELLLKDTGIYNIKVVDQLGRCQKFGEQRSSIFKLTLLNDVPFYVKDENSESANLSPIPYQTFNNEVTLYIPQTYGTVTTTIKRNNVDYTAETSGDMIKFTLPGTYNVELTGNVAENYGSAAAPLKASYTFTILSKEIAIKSYNFAPISGHKITSVERLVDEEWQQVAGINNVYTLLIDTSDEKFDEGEYRINVTYSGAKSTPQNYSFSFWLSSDEPSLSSSRAWGSTSTKPFEISFTPSLLYKAVGDCSIVVTSEKGSETYQISKESLEQTDSQSMTFKDIGVYVIQIVSADGTILSTYRMTIKTPLNAAAIMIIAIGAGGVAFGAFAFFKMRRKMKVR